SATQSGVWVAQASESIRIVAERIGVDRAYADPAVSCVLAQEVPVVDPVPRDMERDTWAAAGQLMHERCVVDPLPYGACSARPGIHVEARAGVSVTPGGGLD